MRTKGWVENKGGRTPYTSRRTQAWMMPKGLAGTTSYWWVETTLWMGIIKGGLLCINSARKGDVAQWLERLTASPVMHAS